MTEHNLKNAVFPKIFYKETVAMQGYPNDADIRQLLTQNELTLVDDLLSENAVMLKLGMNYQQRKAQLNETALNFYRQGATQ
ncbi:hypothetical protein QV01_09290 [Gallibacterium genomosp. 3]|uniref:Uncharacterized protein n=1 Tax=Gallibacterium genomosp. 3 TaxID=505345 RepID=A0A1A7NMY5_9PAST|nr:hypothetical protein [Gallibacterium genomosp. 3]OBW90973.1 hypothetical protein QV01_09290 [Gallibacterium genomosp. 3]